MTADEYFDRTRQERMGQHQFFFNAWRALSFNNILGDYAEFGSWGGVTFSMSHMESRRQGGRPHLWAFDSFQGLPAQKDERDSHPVWQPGTLKTSVEDFHRICAANRIPRSEYTAVVGFYEETLDRLATPPYPTDIALAYVDCDLYSSTMSVLRFLEPRLKHGMIIAFDDYFCWSATQLSGEHRAKTEMFASHPRWHLEPYQNFGWHGLAFVVQDRRLLEAIGR